jgi:branched-chain amino acid transport system ATP-binding protein
LSSLDIHEIVAGYDGPPIVRGASVRVQSGQVAVIVGPNGAGKSTLAKAAVGLLKVQKGTVHLDSINVTGRPPYELVRQGLVYLPQLMNVFDDLTVMENLEMGGYTYSGNVSQRISAILDLFPDLHESSKRHAGHLSGGQQRMLALARILMVDPKIAILDEPTAGLAPSYMARVWSRILQIRDEGVGLIVVEQNVSTALSHADYVFVLVDGQVAIEGPPDEVAANEELGYLMVG